MTDHWDHDDDAFGFDLPDDHTPLHEPLDPAGHHDDHDTWDLPDADDLPHAPDLPDLHEEVAAVADDTVFPPALEVDLPEPIDGFPWTDPATLGAADPTGFLPPVENVTPQELAAYAGIEIPDGADPWAVLAASDDPATAALAKWWTTGEQ
ncbi:hypothetical protein Aph02nite_47580 [Actinoplanes philippinensis]|uniref:Uncharacterized protein n=1 Tax=Actinoplanes philippinensis TaxID=35752 RepID=A0A1I2HZ62_9ACTN|nr:hypothetical protein [Actinoplanes philippinensis]GIE78808.1 hypothetical protein Aph02nite_47580 [Actinoplanes philippinensis]SFF35324.1 hypothetical protein SAMN05421541_109128 [Actinoplanes philippinensis]